jgi:hypothetical protein
VTGRRPVRPRTVSLVCLVGSEGLAHPTGAERALVRPARRVARLLRLLGRVGRARVAGLEWLALK